MDKKVFPILLSLLVSSVLSTSLEDSELSNDYENRINEARERVIKLISQLIPDGTSNEGYTETDGEQDATYSDLNIPMLEHYLAKNAGEDVIGPKEALFMKALSSNGTPLDAKRSGTFECLEESCEDIERRRQPSRNAHYRTLPFGKRVQRRTTVRIPRKSMRNKTKARGTTLRQTLLPFGK